MTHPMPFGVAGVFCRARPVGRLPPQSCATRRQRCRRTVSTIHHNHNNEGDRPHGAHAENMPKVVIVLLVILAILAWLFSWNLLRGPIARKVTEATGRSAAINGDLHVKLSFTQSPWITADNVQLGNPDWATNKKHVYRR